MIARLFSFILSFILVALGFVGLEAQSSGRDTIPITVEAPPPEASSAEWVGNLTGLAGDTLAYAVTVVDTAGNPAAGTVSWAVSNAVVARVASWNGRILLVELLAPGSVNVVATVTPEDGPGGVPPPPGSHEPEGFASLIDEDYEDIYRQDGAPHFGTPEAAGCRSGGERPIANGVVRWIYEAGRPGGSTPCHIIGWEGGGAPVGGPYHYLRHEGLRVSANFQGHQSGVNKVRYFTDRCCYASSGIGITLLVGYRDGPLRPGINEEAWVPNLGEFNTGRLRWNSDANLADPTAEEATFTRGEPHTLETLFYLGEGPGTRSAWVKVWLDGILVLHFAGFDGPGELVGGRMVMGGLHVSPVWGGAGDTVAETMWLEIDRTYVSAAESCPSCLA